MRASDRTGAGVIDHNVLWRLKPSAEDRAAADGAAPAELAGAVRETRVVVDYEA